MTAAISARGVRASLGGKQVLHGIDLQFSAGRWTAVVGPNGAGKSTLLRVLAGLLAHEGEVFLGERNMASVTAKERARQISWLGQGEDAADDLSVYDVTMLGRLPHQRWLASPSAADHIACEQALRATRTWDWRDRLLGQLSAGERQRALLSRALAVEADILLMDEPLVNLDPPHQADWLHLVRSLAVQGKTVVSVLHETSLALRADEMVVMDAGHVLHRGACGDSATHRALEGVFARRLRVHSLAGQWVALPD